jgi:hypothetical protein
MELSVKTEEKYENSGLYNRSEGQRTKRAYKDKVRPITGLEGLEGGVEV